MLCCASVPYWPNKSRAVTVVKETTRTLNEAPKEPNNNLSGKRR